MTAHWSEMLASTGWVVLKPHDTGGEVDLDRVSSSLGAPVRTRAQRFQSLTPMSPDLARPSSLSAIYGLGRFPFHNDTAHLPRPARWLLIKCDAPGNDPVATLLLDSRHLAFSPRQNNLAKSAVFFVRNGRRSFYASILGDPRFIRCDPGCFEPTGAHAAEAMALFQLRPEDPRVSSVHLKAGEILLVDNWRVLHGRASVPESSRDRRMVRGLVA